MFEHSPEFSGQGLEVMRISLLGTGFRQALLGRGSFALQTLEPRFTELLIYVICDLNPGTLASLD